MNFLWASTSLCFQRVLHIRNLTIIRVLHKNTVSQPGLLWPKVGWLEHSHQVRHQRATWSFRGAVCLGDFSRFSFLGENWHKTVLSSETSELQCAFSLSQLCELPQHLGQKQSELTVKQFLNFQCQSRKHMFTSYRWITVPSKHPPSNYQATYRIMKKTVFQKANKTQN